jgi:hypothetical protein
MAFLIGGACLTLTDSHCYFSGGPGIITPGLPLGFGVTPNHSSDELIEGWSGHVGGPYISIGTPGAVGPGLSVSGLMVGRPAN